ncbi:MAG: hypothetical protein IPO76_00810 [Elusimicrobia bacterium]|nr:hypothetical protein [Elusimicrobiota bacterium]
MNARWRLLKVSKNHPGPGAERVTAFGTSALRDSANSDIFLATISGGPGIDVRVISVRGSAAHRQGILAHEERDARDRVALVDISGGSVEVTPLPGPTHSPLPQVLNWAWPGFSAGFLKTVPRSSGGENHSLVKLRRHPQPFARGPPGRLAPGRRGHRFGGGHVARPGPRPPADGGSVLRRARLRRWAGLVAVSAAWGWPALPRIPNGSTIARRRSFWKNAEAVRPTVSKRPISHLRDEHAEEEARAIRGAGSALVPP